MHRRQTVGPALSTLVSLGLTHPQLPQCVGSTLLSTAASQGRTSADLLHDPRARSPLMCRWEVGPSQYSSQMSLCPWATAQTRLCGGNWPLLLWAHRPRCDSRWQHRPGLPHGPRWHLWLLIPGCSSLPSSLKFCVFFVSRSFCFSFSSVSSPLALSGAWGLWVSGILSGVLCPSHAIWCQAGVILGICPIPQGLCGARLVVIQASSLYGPVYPSGGHLGLAPCLACQRGPMQW